MAIISTLIRRVRNTVGDRVITTGTYAGGTNGEVDTHLEICEQLILQGTASVVGSAAVVTEQLPTGGTAVSIETADPGGIWFAYGR